MKLFMRSYVQVLPLQSLLDCKTSDSARDGRTGLRCDTYSEKYLRI